MLGELAPRARYVGLGSTDVITGNKSFNPSGVSGNEVIGSGAVAITPGAQNTVLGATASVAAAGTGNTLIGYAAHTGAGNYSVCIGDNASCASSFGIAIGGLNTTVSAASGIALGYAVTAGANQLVIGSSSVQIYTMCVGHGITDSAAAHTFTLFTTGGSGTDQAGSDFIIQGGASTGAGAAGQIRLQVSPVAGTGAGVNAPSDAVMIDSNRNVFLNASTVALGASATQGFIHIPNLAGTPGTPGTTKTGATPMVFDTTANKLWVFYGAAWHFITFT